MNKEAFFKYVAVIPFHSCWEWVGATNGTYGIYGGSLSKKRGLAHRLSYEIHFGNIPAGFFVCHKCDNPLCVNPDHLFLGTPADNTRDMVNKKRARGGHKPTKLSAKDIVEIRQSNLSTRELGKIYGVCGSYISQIKRGKRGKNHFSYSS